MRDDQDEERAAADHSREAFTLYQAERLLRDAVDKIDLASFRSSRVAEHDVADMTARARALAGDVGDLRLWIMGKP